MDGEFPQTLHPPSSLPMENQVMLPSGHAETQAAAQSPFITTSDLGIESAFSEMSLQRDLLPADIMPQFSALPTAYYGRPSVSPARLPLQAGGDNQQHLLSTWGRGRGGGGGANGPIGFVGDQQNLNVGPPQQNLNVGPPQQNLNVGPPQQVGFFDSGAFSDSSALRTRREFSDCSVDSCSCCPFHAKQPSMRKFHSSNLLEEPDFRVPAGLDNRRLRNLGGSFGYGEYISQDLYQLQQRRSPSRQIASLVRDQPWCNELTSRLDRRASEQEIEVVLSDVIESICELMTNNSGSQFVEKLFMACNEEQRNRIVFSLTKAPFKFINVCLDSIGAKAIHSLLEKMNSQQQLAAIRSTLTPVAAVLANDLNSQHVVVFFVKRFSGEYDEHFANEIVNNSIKMATNKSGCCVLQSCMDNFHGRSKDHLVQKIVASASVLSEDPYGNYVVQHLLGMRNINVSANLARQLQGNFVYLSCNKYASNVVEKILSETGEMCSAAIIMELVSSPIASKLLVDPYGNFVIQSALKNSKEQVHKALLNLIRINIDLMQSNPFGKKVIAWVEKNKLQHG